jgi:2-isopropylmalate synthase
LLDSTADALVLVAKASDYQVRVALETTLEDNLKGIAESVGAIVAKGREAIIDCEHYFDGYKSNPAYALKCAKTAYESGARWIVLCDTNGGTLPDEIRRIVAETAQIVPGDQLGIHAHDDCGCAVANSLAAVEAGARHIQGTLNGLGERCGNANLVTLIGTLTLKPSFAERFDTGIDDRALSELTHVSRALDEILNRAPNRHAPFVGASAFATKAGIHASAVLKDPQTYEHVMPESVGNQRRLLVSDQAGRSNILAELDRVGIRLKRDDRRLARVLEEVKDKEAEGYAFEGADASFFLLAKRILGEAREFFAVERYSVSVERRHNARGELVTFSEAVVRVKVGDQQLISAAEGNGPFNALDLALRKDLGVYQALIEDLELLDYKVRIFQGGSDAVTRVLIEFGDRHGERWTTVGVSGNLVDASFQALTDAITYKLMKETASA